MGKKIKVIETPDLTQPFSVELLGQAVKARRTQSQLKIEDAATLCGVAKQTLLDLEHGKASIKLESILKICFGLGLSLAIQPWEVRDVAQEVVDEWH